MGKPDNSTPLSTARAFLAGIKGRDPDSMKSLCHPAATACLIRNGEPMHLTVEDILQRILWKGPIEQDEVSHDEIEHVHGHFATVWTPYRFLEDGKLHHTGANNFCLWKNAEKGWLITAVQDIAVPEAGVGSMQVIGSHDAAS